MGAATIAKKWCAAWIPQYVGPGAGATGKIAFESDRDSNIDVYVMNADGSGPTNLTNNPASDKFPAWSPLP